MAIIADVYRYRELDITLMTDEQENRNTNLWPSAGNIVSFFLQGYLGSHPCMLTLLNCSWARSTISLGARLAEMCLCCIVRFCFCAILLSLVHHVFLDAGHCGKQIDEVGGKQQCASLSFLTSSAFPTITSVINTCEQEMLLGTVSVPHSSPIQYSS